MNYEDRMKRLFGEDWKPQPAPVTISNVTIIDDRGDVLVVQAKNAGWNPLFSEEQIGDGE